jgi:DNA adenine methylase
MEHSLVVKPILKWVGGKTQILDKLLSRFPKTIVNYHEPFLGGGSVLLGLLSAIKNKEIVLTGKVCAYDINEVLIYMYKNIQNHPNELLEEIQKIINEYNSLPENLGLGPVPSHKKKIIPNATESKEHYYYWTRLEYNNMSLEEKKLPKGSAYFIFLNKTGFRGVYREGPSGLNVPYGNYKNPEILSRDHLLRLHDLIQSVEFHHLDFTTVLKSIKDKDNKDNKDDFVYLDPPYFPEKSTSFVGYTNLGFNLEQHQTLFDLCHSLPCNWIMSNSDVPIIYENFSAYTIEKIICKRSIHYKTPESKAKEVIIHSTMILTE